MVARIRGTIAILVALLATILTVEQPGLGTTDQLRILDLQYQDHSNVYRVVLSANLPFMYKVVKAGKGTIRIEADKADISSIASSYNIGSKVVKNVSISNRPGFDNGDITEIIIKYNPDYQFTHSIKGRRLFVEFVDKNAGKQAGSRPQLTSNNSNSDSDNSTDEEFKVTPVKLASADITNADIAGTKTSNYSQTNEAVNTSSVSRYSLKAINSYDAPGVSTVEFSFDSKVKKSDCQVVDVGPPARFVMDFHGALNTLKKKDISKKTNHFNRIRTAQFTMEPYPISRVVFDQTTEEKPQIVYDGAKVLLIFGSAQEPSIADTKTANSTKNVTKKKKTNTSEKVSADKLPPLDASPKSNAGGAKSADSSMTKPNGKAASNTKKSATNNTAKSAESTLNKPLIEKDLESKENGKSKENVDLFAEQFPDSMNSTNAGNTPSSKKSLTVPKEFNPGSQAEQQTEINAEPSDQEQPSLVVGDQEFFQTKEISLGKRQYVGKQVSLEFESIPLSSLILLLGQMTDKNFLLDPSVRSVEVSIILKDVPWDQALDVILDYHGLGKVEEGNLIRIASKEKLAQEAEERQRLAEQQSLAVPLRQVTKPINYAKASDMASLIQRNLSSKGEVVVDERTNTMVISDIPSKVDEHLNLIEALDIPTKQVIVEARIIETTRDFVNELGLQYGFRGSAASEWGSSTGLIFPNQVSVSGAVPLQGGAASNPGESPLAINLPAPSANTSLVGTFSNITGSFLLDAILTAAESEKKVRVLSRPRISATNNQQATIKSGVEVPFQVVQNNTVSIRFREATLKLEVTPHITSDSTVIMDVVVDKSSLGIATAQGFTIQTRQATSTIRVKDGGVAVIGGVLEISDSITEERTPFLHRLPIIGMFFKNKLARTQNTELLIFIAPKIIG